MSKAGFVISFIIGVIAVLLILAWAETEEYEPYTVTPALTTENIKTSSTPEVDIPQFRANFMGECVSDETNRAYCECVYNDLVARYTWKELIIMDGQVTDNNVPEELLDSVIACMDKL